MFECIMTNTCDYILTLCSFVLGLTDNGWHREDGQLRVTWDTTENIKQIQCSVKFLTQGCKCKTGCTSRRCRCKKAELQCGPSCQCINCRNTSSYMPSIQETEDEVQEEIREQIQEDIQQGRHEEEYEDEELSTGDEETDSDEVQRLEALNREVDDIMEEIFGIPF